MRNAALKFTANIQSSKASSVSSRERKRLTPALFTSTSQRCSRLSSTSIRVRSTAARSAKSTTCGTNDPASNSSAAP